MDRDDREHDICCDFQVFLSLYRSAVEARVRGDDALVAERLDDARRFVRVLLGRLLRREATPDEVESLVSLDRPVPDWPRTKSKDGDE